MDQLQTIRSQYLSALAMLGQAVTRCPDELWNDANDTTKFWHIAYHALFYTHFYLQKTEEDFQAWSNHRTGYHTFDPEIGEPYTKAEVMEYLEFCQSEVDRCVATLDLTAPSGFHWLSFNKFELQIYSIRHIQQHAGELMERLGSRAGIELDWVGHVR